jgi:hypothetical protein
MDVRPYGMTGRLARFSGWRPWMVVALWVVLFGGARVDALAATRLGRVVLRQERRDDGPQVI